MRRADYNIGKNEAKRKNITKTEVSSMAPFLVT